jgi:hypothetical protein
VELKAQKWLYGTQIQIATRSKPPVIVFAITSTIKKAPAIVFKNCHKQSVIYSKTGNKWIDCWLRIWSLKETFNQPLFIDEISSNSNFFPSINTRAFGPSVPPIALNYWDL